MFHVLTEMRKPELDRLRRTILPMLNEPERTEVQVELDRPQTKLATIAKRLAKLWPRENVEPQHVADRLRRHVRKSNFTAADMADLEGLVYGNSPRSETIRSVLAGLQRLGVKVEIPWPTKSAD
jgi:hypothetical protein